jgi:hypothetical protein
VPGREAERQAVLTQIVADRHFATKGVAPFVDGHVIQVVGVGLHQDGHIQCRELDCLGYAVLVAKIGQGHQDALDLATMGAEQGGAALRVGPGLHGAQGRGVFFEDDRRNAGGAQHGQHLAPRLTDEMVGEKVAVADNDAEHCLPHELCLHQVIVFHRQ